MRWLKKRHRLAIGVILGVLGAIPLAAPVRAQDDPAATSSQDWKAEFRARNANTDINDAELRWLDEFRRRYPQFADEDLLTILRWHREHPKFDEANLSLIVDWHRQFPGFSDDDMVKFWRLNKLYPKFDQDELTWLARFHDGHPWFGMNELGRVFQFHTRHPEIPPNHVADMLRYWDEHRKHPPVPFEQAYAEYKKDPERFRQKHKIPAANAQRRANLEPVEPPANPPPGE